MRLGWSRDRYRLDGIVPQDFYVGSDGPATGILLAQRAKGVPIPVTDRRKRLEVVEVPDEYPDPTTATRGMACTPCTVLDFMVVPSLRITIDACPP